MKPIKFEVKHDLDIPSGLIRHGLEALQYFEETEGFEVKMTRFVERDHKTGIYYACIGSAAYMCATGDTTAIAGRGLMVIEESLDEMRLGYVGRAFEAMGL